MATTRQGTKMITMAPEAEELVTQPKRPEGGRFRLQVDRQTKESYTTCEAAEAAGMEIKKAYAVLQVAGVRRTSGAERNERPLRPVLSSAGERVTNSRKGCPAWRHPERVSEMIFTDADAI